MSEPALSDLEIRFSEQEGFRRAQVIALSDALAAAHGEMALLRSRLNAPIADDRDNRIAELTRIVGEKDEQITEQSKTIVELRAEIEGLSKPYPREVA